MNLHKLLCFFGIHIYGESYHDDKTRYVEFEFPYKRVQITDERIYKKCIVCSNKKLIYSHDNPLK